MKRIFYMMGVFGRKMKSIWKKAIAENWFEGIRLSVFGGSIDENIKYLKDQNRKI